MQTLKPVMGSASDDVKMVEKNKKGALLEMTRDSA